MGVTKLWDVVQGSGRKVPEEALRGKRVAIDVSIWLNSFVKVLHERGDSKASHIRGIFLRCCKLLFYQIQPVFVFDGGIPQLKLNTIHKRRKSKNISRKKLEETIRQLFVTRLGQFAARKDNQNPEEWMKQLKEELQTLQDSVVDEEGEEEKKQEIEQQEDSNTPEPIILSSEEEIDPDWLDDSSDEERTAETSKEEIPAPTNPEALLSYQMEVPKLKKEEEILQDVPEDVYMIENEDDIDLDVFRELTPSIQKNLVSQLQRKRKAQSILAPTTPPAPLPVIGAPQFSISPSSPAIASSPSDFSLLQLQSCLRKGKTVQKITQMQEIMRNEGWRKVNSNDNEYQILLKSNTPTSRDTVFGQGDNTPLSSSHHDPSTSPTNEPREKAIAIMFPDSSGDSEDSSDDEDVSFSPLVQKLLRKGISEPSTPPNHSLHVPVASDPSFLSSDSDIDEFIYELPSSEVKASSESLGAVESVNKNSSRISPLVPKRALVMLDHSDDSDDEPISGPVLPPKASPVVIEIEENSLASTSFPVPIVDTRTVVHETMLTIDDIESQEESSEESMEELQPAPSISPSHEPSPHPKSPKHVEEDTNIQSEIIERHRGSYYQPPAIMVSPSQRSSSSPSVPRGTNSISNYFESNAKPLEKLSEQLELEANKLSQLARQQTVSIGSVTSNMVIEVQKLLNLFGIPFVVAPSEAESQCAKLLDLGLVDAIATEDSDVFLFGGTSIYRHLFNQKKEIECYSMDLIEAETGLTREKLIDFALLVGSDYTDGIKGIGTVLALEVLAEFGTVASFAVWCKEGMKDVSLSSPSRSSSSASSVKKKLKRMHMKGSLHIPENFPDERVRGAYLAPHVNASKEPFLFSMPNRQDIRDFMRDKVGWSSDRTDRHLEPVIRSVANYFSDPPLFVDEILFLGAEYKVSPRLKSTRVTTAFQLLTGSQLTPKKRKNEENQNPAPKKKA